MSLNCFIAHLASSVTLFPFYIMFGLTWYSVVIHMSHVLEPNVAYCKFVRLQLYESMMAWCVLCVNQVTPTILNKLL